MKLSTELKLILGVVIAVALYLLYRKLKAAAGDVNKTIADAVQNFNSNFDANTAPVAGVSLNDAIKAGTIPNPITDAPWWAQTLGAVGVNVPYSWWATPTPPANTGGATGSW